MWLFRNKSSSQNVKNQPQSITNAFAVFDSSDKSNEYYKIKVFETKYDAQVECKRLELVHDVATDIKEVTLYGPSKESFVYSPSRTTLSFEDLPEDVRREIDERERGIKKNLDDEHRSMSVLAKNIEEKWKIIVEDCMKKIEKANNAKDVAIKAYIKDRSMTSARVREICDARSHDISSFKKIALEQGNKLVECEKMKAGNEYVCEVDIDDLVVRGLLLDLDAKALHKTFEEL